MACAPSSCPAPALAIACCAALLAIGPGPARAAAKPAVRIEASGSRQPDIAREAAEPSGAWTSAAPPAGDCSRARRKLWQAGEGWIVKTITTCR